MAAYTASAAAFADKEDDRTWLRPLVAMFAAALPSGALVGDAGFTVERHAARETPYGCNAGAHGWIETLARR